MNFKSFSLSLYIYNITTANNESNWATKNNSKLHPMISGLINSIGFLQFQLGAFNDSMISNIKKQYSSMAVFHQPTGPSSETSTSDACYRDCIASLQLLLSHTIYLHKLYIVPNEISFPGVETILSLWSVHMKCQKTSPSGPLLRNLMFCGLGHNSGGVIWWGESGSRVNPEGIRILVGIKSCKQ